MRLTSIPALLAGAALLAMAALPAAAQQPKILKFSHTDTAVGARQKTATMFAEKVEAYTQGRYKVQVFHSGQLANDPKSLEQLQVGGIDFAVTGAGTYATHVKTLNLTALPYLVDTYEQGWKLYDESQWFKDQFAQLPAKGMRILATWEAGFRSFTTKGPLATLDDAKGKKMRIFPNDMIRWIMEAFTFNPVVMPVTEVYLAIQQGTVIGQENPIDTIYSQRFYEVAPYITLTQHVYSPIPMAISERTWAGLSPADREAVTRAAKEAADFIRKEVRATDDGFLKEMAAKGAKVSNPDTAPFKKAVESVYAKAKEVYGAEVDKILKDAEEVKRTTPKS